MSQTGVLLCFKNYMSRDMPKNVSSFVMGQFTKWLDICQSLVRCLDICCKYLLQFWRHLPNVQTVNKCPEILPGHLRFVHTFANQNLGQSQVLPKNVPRFCCAKAGTIAKCPRFCKQKHGCPEFCTQHKIHDLAYPRRTFYS